MSTPTISAYNWGQITSGATFQALVNVLLLHDDPKTIVFTKEGPDGGLDAITGDWTGAFQAKFHANAKPSHAFADARDELENIKKYRTAGHERYAQWEKVTKWTLITNAPFGPDDALRWQNDIEPEFAKLGITETKCEGVTWCDQQLAKHADVAECFFGGKTRCFQSLAEFRERVAEGILANAFEQPLLDRDAAMQRVKAFATDPTARLLLVHGPGGVGKTRFLCEAAQAASQLGGFGAVYAATKTAESSPEWYRGIVADIPALVIVDEPQDPKFIDVLLDQLGGRAKQWKVIIATRSPNHPILQPLRNPRLTAVARPDLELKALTDVAALQAARTLIAQNVKLQPTDEAAAAEWLARISGGIPIWIVIGVRVLAERGDLRELPADRWRVAAEYLHEIVIRGPSVIASPAQVTQLLRWIALVQPINRQDGPTIEFLAKEAGFGSIGDLERALISLRERRVVAFYGIDQRRVEIRPDVMRDFIVRDWLTLSDNADDPGGARRPSADAAQLVTRMVDTIIGKDKVPLLREAVITLGRLELLMDIRLLDPLADWTVRAAQDAADAATQLDVIGVAKLFGPFRPKVFTSIINMLNSRDVDDGYRELE